MATHAQRKKLNADPVSDAHIMLVEVQEDGQTTVHRAAVNNEDITHNSNTYTATNMQISLPSSGSKDNTVSLSISNIPRTLGSALMRARNLVGCRIILIDSSVPNTAIKDTENKFVLRNTKVTNERITASLGPRSTTKEPFPFQRTGKDKYPGVWLNRR